MEIDELKGLESANCLRQNADFTSRIDPICHVKLCPKEEIVCESRPQVAMLAKIWYGFHVNITCGLQSNSGHGK